MLLSSIDLLVCVIAACFREVETIFKYCVGFEVLTAVVMKSTVFWDITPCSPLSVDRRFGETSPPSSASNIKRTRNQGEGRWQAEFCLPPAFMLASSANFFDPEDGGDMFLRNVG
jgi:hypothetical protein